jgi:hypothetical protein
MASNKHGKAGTRPCSSKTMPHILNRLINSKFLDVPTYNPAVQVCWAQWDDTILQDVQDSRRQQRTSTKPGL